MGVVGVAGAALALAVAEQGGGIEGSGDHFPREFHDQGVSGVIWPGLGPLCGGRTGWPSGPGSGRGEGSQGKFSGNYSTNEF